MTHRARRSPDAGSPLYIATLAMLSACGPAVTASPPPAAPPVPVVAAPVEPVRPIRLTLARRHEPHRYTVRSTSTIVRDSAGTPLAETIEATGFVTFDLERTGESGTGSPLGVRSSGRVEQFVLSTSARLAAARTSALTGVAKVPDLPTLPLTVPFEAMVEGTITRVSPTPPLANECDRPETAATALARELLVRLPDALAAGDAWSDTTRVFVCRGGVPVTILTVSNNRAESIVEGPDGRDYRARVIRDLRVRAEGEQKSAWRSVGLTGQGTARQELVVDLPSGVVRELTSASEMQFDVRDSARPDGGRERVTQRLAYRGVLEEGAP